MLNGAPARTERRIHYGWIVAAVTFATLLTTAGAMSTPGLLIVPLQTEFGWSAGTVSTALSLRMAVFGLMAPFGATLLLQLGLRKVMLAAVSITGLGMALTAFVATPWQLAILWGLIVGGGTGLTALVLGATVANVWFVERRGLVVGLMTASSASGQLIFLPAFARINETWGWRPLVLVVAACLVCLVPIIFLLMVNRPADIGLKAYGEKADEQLSPQSNSFNPVAASFATLGSALRSRDFWLLSFGFLVCGSSTNGLIGTHFITACSDAGIVATLAAGLLALMGAFDLFGTVVCSPIATTIGSCSASITPFAALLSSFSHMRSPQIWFPFPSLRRSTDLTGLQPSRPSFASLQHTSVEQRDRSSSVGCSWRIRSVQPWLRTVQGGPELWTEPTRPLLSSRECCAFWRG